MTTKSLGLLSYFLSSFKGIGSKIADFASSASSSILGPGYTPILAALGKAAIDLTKNALTDRFSGFLDDAHDSLKSISIGNTSDFKFKAGNKIAQDKSMSDITMTGAQRAAKSILKKHLKYEPFGKKRKLDSRMTADESAKDLILEEKSFKTRGFEEEEEDME